MNNKKIVWAIIGIALASLLFVTACKLEVNDPVRIIPIIEPYISVQPKGASYNSEAGSFTVVDALSVEVSDWKSVDGKLSYQWYTFTTMEAYCASGGTGTIIEGETRRTYMPDITDTAPGKTYYYYVKVRNYFADATGDTEAFISSEIAIISFYGNAQTPIPIITKHPANATYVIGKTNSISPLEVRAIVDGDGTLSYQWFTNDRFGISGGEEIEDATLASYMPEPSQLKKGANYFYVEVINETNRGKTKPISLPVIVTMKPGEKAEKPRITLQPKDQLVFIGEDAPKIIIEAITLDEGDISYEWYQMDKPGTTTVGGSRVPPALVSSTPVATTAVYEPPVSAAGSRYYRVTVTNTNTDIEDDTKQVATVDSKIITVTVASPTASTSANATITIPDTYNTFGHSTRRQYIRGFGGMDVAWSNFPGQYQENTHTMYNPDWGLGFNILRIMIQPPGSTDPNYTSHDVLMDKLLKTGTVALNNSKADYIENVKIVNGYDGYVLASPWSPPKEWKTNNSINSGGHLIHSYYKNFATYLRSFCQYMYYKGAPIYAVSIANEPNYAGGYDGCEWTSIEMRDFFKQEGQFTEGVRGYGGGKSIPRVLVMNGESANHPNINFEALADPVSRNAIDLYARHVYGDQEFVLWRGGFGNGSQYASWQEGDQYQTECWMTEHNINSATASTYPNDWTWNYIWRFMNDVDLVIRINHENAFVWWANVRFYSFIGDGVGNSVRNAILPRGYGLSHFAKYTIDTTRIRVNVSGFLANGTTPIVSEVAPSQSPNVNGTRFNLNSLDAKITAYVSKDGNEISFVMYTPTLVGGGSGHDLGRIEIKMPAGFRIGSAKAQRSTATTKMVLEDVTVAGDRKSAFVSLPPSNILSLKFTNLVEDDE
jgi:O-glycosyl hydrolase